MKLLIAALFSFSAFAAEPIKLDRAEIEIPSSILKEPITLLRTVNSPKKIVLTIPSHPLTTCAREEMQTVTGPHPSCGTYRVPIVQMNPIIVRLGPVARFGSVMSVTRKLLGKTVKTVLSAQILMKMFPAPTKLPFA